MSRFIATVVALGMAAAMTGCGGRLTKATGNDVGTTNIEMADPRVAPPVSRKAAITIDSPPLLDAWMKVPPLTLRDEINRLLRCGGPDHSRRRCNLSYHEDASARSPTEDWPSGSYAVATAVTVPAGMFDVPPTRALPRAPFRVVHHLLPRWRQADAWLSFALPNARRMCGMQTRVGNALVSISATLGILEKYEVRLELAPYRASIAREHAACIEGEEDDINQHAEALSAGLPWKESPRSARK